MKGTVNDMKKKLIIIAVLLFVMSNIMFNFASCSEAKTLTAEVLPVKGGRSGIVTIVHDDGDLPSARFMLKEFEEKGLCGTFAMIADKVVSKDGVPTANAAEWQSIVRTGYFDIANHTQSHTWYGFGGEGGSGTYIKKDGTVIEYEYEPGHMTDEIVGAAERMREIFSDQKILCYVIPGFTNAQGYEGRTPEAIKIIEDNFISQRNTGGAGDFDGTKVDCLNNISDIDFSSLNCMMVNASDDYRTRWFEYVDNIIEYQGWGIYCFHNIWETEVPSGHNVAQSKASELFEYIADKSDSGELWCATLTEGTLYTKEYNNASLDMTVSGKQIELTLKDRLNDEIYDMPLTVRVDVFKNWDKAVFEYDGKTETVNVRTAEDGSRYILVDMVPDRGTAVIKEG